MSAFCLPDSSSSDHHFNHQLAAATVAAAARPPKLLKSSHPNVVNVNVSSNQHPISSSLLPCSSWEEAARIHYAYLSTDLELSRRANLYRGSDSTYSSSGSQLPQDGSTMLNHHSQIHWQCNTGATSTCTNNAVAGLSVITQWQPLSSNNLNQAVVISDDETLMTAPKSASPQLDHQSAYSTDDHCSSGRQGAAPFAVPELTTSCGMNPDVLDMLLDSATSSASRIDHHVGVNVRLHYSIDPDLVQPSCAGVMEAEALLAEQNNCNYNTIIASAAVAAGARLVPLNPAASEQQPQPAREKPIRATPAPVGCSDVDANLEVPRKRDQDVGIVNHNNNNSNISGGAAAAAKKAPNYVAGKGRVRARRGEATDVHSISERNRRIRITERMKALQKLVPHSTKTNKAAMLDQILQYVSSLQLRLKCTCMRKVNDTPDAAHSQRLNTYHASSSSSMEDCSCSKSYYSHGPDRPHLHHHHEYNVIHNVGAADYYQNASYMSTSTTIGRGVSAGPRLQGYLERVLDPLEERISEAERQFTRLLNSYNDHRENDRLQEALQFLGGYGLCLMPISHVQSTTAPSTPSSTAISNSQPAAYTTATLLCNSNVKSS